MYQEWMKNIPLDYEIEERYGNLDIIAIDNLIEEKIEENRNQNCLFGGKYYV